VCLEVYGLFVIGVVSFKKRVGRSVVDCLRILWFLFSFGGGGGFCGFGFCAFNFGGVRFVTLFSSGESSRCLWGFGGGEGFWHLS